MIRSVNVKKTKSSKKIILKITMSMTEAERECGARLFQCCREPSHTKKLDMSCLLFPRLPTVAVMDANSFDASNVKEGEIHSGGRHFAFFTDMMSELVFCTKIKQCSPRKELTCPFLEDAH